ncbi:MAG: hypothetical protein PHE63_12420 [Eubacteriales bacterium]|nr:hypothetical protein [Eubacteriales bacterium]
MNKNQKIVVSIVIPLILLITILLVVKSNNRSPYDFLQKYNRLSKAENASEFLYQADVGDSEYLVFYINENGNAACAIIKKSFLNYTIQTISSEIHLSDTDQSANFHYSSYSNGQKWIYWGIIRDSNVKNVLVDDTEANLADSAYSFRICYLFRGTNENAHPKFELVY